MGMESLGTTQPTGTEKPQEDLALKYRQTLQAEVAELEQRVRAPGEAPDFTSAEKNKILDQIEVLRGYLQERINKHNDLVKEGRESPDASVFQRQVAELQADIDRLENVLAGRR
jgi:uncharacterized coiled-coil DUF342 family protein